MAANILATEQDGRQLAVDMLRELRHDFLHQDLSGIPDAEIGEAMVSREPEILRRYLATVRDHPELERGFLCVLSHCIGSHLAELANVYLERRYER